MILDEVTAAVSLQLDQQSKLGVEIRRLDHVPETGPVKSGLWFQVPGVTALFADLKGSTELSANCTPKVVARAYTYFIRAMTVAFKQFGADYIDIQGDGLFGLFSGSGSQFRAATCAIAMKYHLEGEVAPKFAEDTSIDWTLTAGFGIDRGQLLVRRLGLRGAKENEVWAGKPVNMAAKLSSLAKPNHLVVSERVFAHYLRASKIRKRALLWACGCDSETQGAGFDVPPGDTACLWDEKPAPEGLGLDFERIFMTEPVLCEVHDPEFCEALVTNKRPR